LCREKVLEIEEKDEQCFYQFLDDYIYHYSDIPLNEVDESIKNDTELFQDFERAFAEFLG